MFKRKVKLIAKNILIKLTNTKCFFNIKLNKKEN